MFTFLATANAIKFTFASPQLGQEFGIGILDIKFLTAFNFLALGTGNFFWVPLSRLLGKRPIILLSLPILVAVNIWSSQTQDYDQLLASSLLSGFASAAAIGIVPAVVADLFYTHERASAMTWFALSLSNGLFLGTLINGLVSQYYSWRINCYWTAIAAGVTWFFAIYAAQETSYHGRDIFRPIRAYGPKKNHWQRMEITKGWIEGQSLWKSIRNMVAIAVYPAVLWAALTTGVFAAW
jgi:MFS family permease